MGLCQKNWVYGRKAPGSVSRKSALQFDFSSKLARTPVCTAVGYLLSLLERITQAQHGTKVRVTAQLWHWHYHNLEKL